MKDDVISRAAAIEALGERPLCWTGGDYELGQREQWDSDVRAVEAVPAADVVPVAHGKWIQFPTLMAYKCSECGRVIQTTDGQRNVSKHYPFCHCGARMDGKDGDDHES